MSNKETQAFESITEHSRAVTVSHVKLAVEAIKQKAHDCKVAHIMQDRLYKAVLAAIAEGRAVQPEAVAAEALRAEDLDFMRWYA